MVQGLLNMVNISVFRQLQKQEGENKKTWLGWLLVASSRLHDQTRKTAQSIF